MKNKRNCHGAVGKSSLEQHFCKSTSVVPIIGSAIGNSRLLGNFVTIGIGGFQSYSIGLII